MMKDGKCQCIDSKKEINVETETCELKPCYEPVQDDYEIKNPLCALKTCVEQFADCPTGVDAIAGCNAQKKCTKFSADYACNECQPGQYMTLDGTCLTKAQCTTQLGTANEDK
jgi:hypothetical protein